MLSNSHYADATACLQARESDMLWPIGVADADSELAVPIGIRGVPCCTGQNAYSNPTELSRRRRKRLSPVRTLTKVDLAGSLNSWPLSWISIL